MKYNCVNCGAQHEPNNTKCSYCLTPHRPISDINIELEKLNLDCNMAMYEAKSAYKFGWSDPKQIYGV